MKAGAGDQTYVITRACRQGLHLPVSRGCQGRRSGTRLCSSAIEEIRYCSTQSKSSRPALPGCVTVLVLCSRTSLRPKESGVDVVLSHCEGRDGMGFFSRALIPRGVRRAAHPVRTTKNALTPRSIKSARRALHPIDNAIYSTTRSLNTKKRRVSTTTYHHGSCSINHRSRETAAKCHRNY